jgi:hypothetical protein
MKYRASSKYAGFFTGKSVLIGFGLFSIIFKELLTGGKKRRGVQARSGLCDRRTRVRGMSAAEISKKLDIASSTASESATRGRQIVEKQKLKRLDEDIE